MRKAFALLMVLWMAATGCMAEEAMLLTVTGQILQSTVLSETGLDAANQVLSRLTIREVAGQGTERAEMLIDGRPMWSVMRQEADEQVHVIFSDMTDYVTAEGQKDGLMLLAGTEETETISFFSPKAYGAFAPELYRLVEEVDAPEMLNYAVTVEHAGASSRYARYMLPAEGINGCWPRIVQAAWPHFYPDGGNEEILEQLCAVTFSDKVQIKRLYDRQGKDMGVQLTGNGTVLGTERKISLTLGYTEGKGGSFSLTAKAVTGKDLLKATASLRESIREEKNTYTFSAEYIHRLNGEEEVWDISASLTETTEEAGMRISGRITFEADGKTNTLEPQLMKTAEETRGTVQLTRKEKKKQTLQALLDLNISAAQLPERPEGVRQVSLAGMTAEEAQLLLFPEQVVLMRAVTYLLDDLEEGQRWQLTHDLKNESWLNGPDVPVQTDTQDMWMVEEVTP